MKKIFVTFFALITLSAAIAASDEYLDPLTFTGTEEQKTQVINYIKKNVYNEYCKGIGQCSASTLRMMEKADLDSFKYLASEAKKHEKEYRQVYKDYCQGIGQCGYTTLKTMFVHEVESASKELTW